MVDLNLKVPAVEKLLDYAASGIGAVAGPLLAPWKASREAKAARIQAKAQAEVKGINAQGQTDSTILIADAVTDARKTFSDADASIQGEMIIGNEIELRLDFQEKKRQSNIGSVVEMAADELGDKEVQNHDIDHDWVARFFSDIQDVTSEHMQRIWAKILAGEVETPGRTSLHTLSILKNMTQRDAILFAEMSAFVFHGFIMNKSEYINEVIEFPSLELFIKMESYGLLKVDDRLQQTIEIPPEGRAFVMGTTAYRISRNNVAFHEVNIPAFPLSAQGHELYHFTESVINEIYLHIIAKFMRENGDFKLERAQVIEKIAVDQFRHTPWILVEPLQSSQDDIHT